MGLSPYWYPRLATGWGPTVGFEEAISVAVPRSPVAQLNAPSGWKTLIDPADEFQTTPQPTRGPNPRCRG